MRIICPTCASHYEVEPANLAPQGQLVRCARCREVWLVRAPGQAKPAAPEAEPVERIEIDVARPGRGPASAKAETATVVDYQAARIRLRRREAAPADGRRATSLSAVAAGAVLLASLMGAYGFRDAVVRHVPAARVALAELGLAAPAERLALRDVHTAMVSDGNEQVLTLQGQIANLSDKPASVPDLTVVVRDDSALPLYTWTATPPQNHLKRGETIAFQSRLVSPPAQGHDVRVSFADATPAR